MIIKIIIKSKTRLVFSNVLIRMILKITIFHPFRVTTIKQRKAKCVFFLFRISHRHRKGRESGATREEKPAAAAQKYIFSL